MLSSHVVERCLEPQLCYYINFCNNALRKLIVPPLSLQLLAKEYHYYLSLIGIILRINFYLLRTFFLILVVFVLFLLSLRFGQILPLAFFRWYTKKSILDRTSGPVEQRIEALSLCGSRWALSEDSGFKSYPARGLLGQKRGAVITGDTVTRLSIPIRGYGKSPEEGQRWNLPET